jgi:cell division protein DivIC
MNRLKGILGRVLPVVRNKFVFTGVLFLIWIGFIDDNNIIAQVEARLKLSAVNTEREFYLKETQKSLDDLKLLQNDRALLEKFAREKYLMKKDNEEIFVFSTEEEEH